MEILDSHRVPEHIQRHSEQVARVGRRLALALLESGEPIDVALVVADSLLHDVAKARCLGSRRDHAREGGRLLREMGFERVARIVERHVVLGAFDPQGGVTEAEVLNYSDKRVQHERVVSLEERFADLLVRYGSLHPEAEARILANWRAAREIEEKIFRRLPFSPEKIGG